jgi:hypothetical protein
LIKWKRNYQKEYVVRKRIIRKNPVAGKALNDVTISENRTQMWIQGQKQKPNILVDHNYPHVLSTCKCKIGNFPIRRDRQVGGEKVDGW